MRVLITGISGFLGKHLAAALLFAEHEVSGIRLDEGKPIERVAEHRVDILDVPSLNAVVAELRPDVIVHLAALSHVKRSWEQVPEFFSVNVLGVENVLAAAATAGARVIFASSSEVYGLVPADEQPISECRGPAPRNPYALTKAAGERLVLSAGGVVVRTFNLIGPGQESTFALPSFAKQLAAHAEGERVTVRVGNLEARRDFVHVSDGAEGFATLVDSPTAAGVYNLGRGSAVSIREALDRLIAISGQDVAVEVDPERLRPIDVPILCADASKLEALGWRPRRDLDQALEDLWWATRSASEAPLA